MYTENKTLNKHQMHLLPQIELLFIQLFTFIYLNTLYMCIWFQIVERTQITFLKIVF